MLQSSQALVPRPTGKVSLWLVLGFGSLGVSERGKRSLDHTKRWSEVGNGARPVKRKSSSSRVGQKTPASSTWVPTFGRT